MLVYFESVLFVLTMMKMGNLKALLKDFGIFYITIEVDNFIF